MVVITLFVFQTIAASCSFFFFYTVCPSEPESPSSETAAYKMVLLTKSPCERNIKAKVVSGMVGGGFPFPLRGKATGHA